MYGVNAHGYVMLSMSKILTTDFTEAKTTVIRCFGLLAFDPVSLHQLGAQFMSSSVVKSVDVVSPCYVQNSSLLQHLYRSVQFTNYHTL